MDPYKSPETNPLRPSSEISPQATRTDTILYWLTLCLLIYAGLSTKEFYQSQRLSRAGQTGSPGYILTFQEERLRYAQIALTAAVVSSAVLTFRHLKRRQAKRYIAGTT